MDPDSYLSLTVNQPHTDTDTSQWVFGSSVTMIPLALLFLISHVYTRRFLRRGSLGWDDVFLLLAGGFLVATLVLSIHITMLGEGLHVWVIFEAPHMSSLMAEKIATSLALELYACSICYSLAMTCIRLAYIASYKRIFPHTFGKWLWVFGGVSIASSLAYIFGLVFMCNPINSGWDWSAKRNHCINIQAFYYAMAAINTLLDVAIWALPIKPLRALQTSKSTKWQLCILFGFGLFGVACSLARIARLWGLQTNDITSSSVMPIAWSIIEVSVAMICACASTLKPLYVIFWNKLKSANRMATVTWGGLCLLWAVLSSSIVVGLNFIWAGLTTLWAYVYKRTTLLGQSPQKDDWTQDREARLLTGGSDPSAIELDSFNSSIARPPPAFARSETNPSVFNAAEVERGCIV